MRNNYVLTIIIFLICNAAIAQVKQARTDSTKKSGDRITVFDRTDRIDPFAGYDSTKNEKYWNAFKLNPFLLMGGDMPIYFERQIMKSSSIEIGIGPTFKNYFVQLLQLDDPEFGFALGDFYDNAMIWKMGFSIKGAYKLYPGKDMMDGVYFSPEIAFRSNAIQYPYYNTSHQPTTVFYNGRYSYVDFKMLFGYESEIFYSDNVLGEWYCGIGIRSNNMKYNKVDYEEDNLGNLVVNNIPSVYNDLKPHFYFGYKIGFKFR